MRLVAAVIEESERWRMRANARMVPWPESKKSTKQLMNHNFVASKNREYISYTKSPFLLSFRA